MYIYIYIYIYMHIFMYVCIYTYMYVCMCLCIYAYIHICMYVCIHTYTQTRKSEFAPQRTMPTNSRTKTGVFEAKFERWKARWPVCSRSLREKLFRRHIWVRWRTCAHRWLYIDRSCSVDIFVQLEPERRCSVCAF